MDKSLLYTISCANKHIVLFLWKHIILHHHLIKHCPSFIWREHLMSVWGDMAPSQSFSTWIRKPTATVLKQIHLCRKTRMQYGAMLDWSGVKGLKRCPRSFPVVLMSHFYHLSLPTNGSVFSFSSACSAGIHLIYFITLFGFDSEHQWAILTPATAPKRTTVPVTLSPSEYERCVRHAK